jgi:hypothetical protein
MSTPASIVEFYEHFNRPILWELTKNNDDVLLRYQSPFVEDYKPLYNKKIVTIFEYKIFDDYVSIRAIYEKIF